MFLTFLAGRQVTVSAYPRADARATNLALFLGVQYAPGVPEKKGPDDMYVARGAAAAQQPGTGHRSPADRHRPPPRE